MIRAWARRLGKPFRIGEALAIMREANPAVTSGPFYHLVRRGEIKKLSRGLFVHPEFYDQFVERGEVDGGVERPTTH